MTVKRLLLAFIVISIFSAFILSCSSETKLFSWKDTTYNAGYINDVLIVAIVKDLEFRNAYEEALVKKLAENNTYSVRSLKILSPAKKYTQEDFDLILDENKLRAVLFINYQGTEIEKIDGKGKTYYKFYKNAVRTTSRKGYYEIHRTVIVETSLFSADSGSIIWFATARTTDAYDIYDLANSLAEEIIRNLELNRLIQPIKTLN